jgi:quercetin dioxygenase-like cupin family protein
VSAVEFVPGLVFRPVVGNQLMANFVRYNPNTAAPLHTHEEEQITVVIEGELEFDLAGDLRIMGPGMAVVVPPGVPHGARTHDTSCFEIDIFHPPRRVLLELTQASGEHLAETAEPSTPLPTEATAGPSPGPPWTSPGHGEVHLERSSSSNPSDPNQSP